jgi:hypothetical protein
MKRPKEYYCPKHQRIFQMGNNCPDCEKVAKEKAAGIESYLASPLEIRNQYFLEKGEDAEGQIVLLDGQTVFYYKKGFVEWLLKKLVEAYAAR